MAYMNDLERQPSQERYTQGGDEESQFSGQVYNGRAEVEPSMYSIPTHHRTTTGPRIRQPEPAKLKTQSKKKNGVERSGSHLVVFGDDGKRVV